MFFSEFSLISERKIISVPNLVVDRIFSFEMSPKLLMFKDLTLRLEKEKSILGRAVEPVFS